MLLKSNVYTYSLKCYVSRVGVAPLQLRCPELIPGLAARPFWDTATLPWIAAFEANFEAIKSELLALRSIGSSSSR